MGTFPRERFRRPDNGNARVAVTSTTSNESVRDSLPDKIENSLSVSSQNCQSLNNGVELVEEPQKTPLVGVFFALVRLMSELGC